MASVKGSRAKIYRTKTSVAEGEPPEAGPSEGELLVKEMVKKQLDTRLTLDDQLQTEKEFEKATRIESVTRYVSGQSTLKDFEESTSKVALREDLLSFGLTGEEIQLLLDRDKGDQHLAEKYKNVESSVLQSRIDTIQSKIDAGILKLRTGESSLEDKSRHEKEIAQSVQPTSDLSKLFQFASKSKPISHETRLPSHPINQLKNIEQELFGHLQKSAKPKKKKIKKLSKDKQVPTESSVNETEASTTAETARKRPGSHWDEKTLPVPNSGSLKREYTCKPEILYTIKNKKIVQITQSATADASTNQPDKSPGPLFGKEFVLSTVPDKKEESTTSSEQLSLEQIRELARFSNYSPGIPSKILFLKNLPNNVKEEDLVSLFGRFESPDTARITYRLMSGKMKGQAFITLSDVETASAAFQAVNGCFLKGRHVIIQFGRSG